MSETIIPESNGGGGPPSNEVKVDLRMDRKIRNYAGEMADAKNTTLEYIVNRAVGTEKTLFVALESGDRIFICDSKGRIKNELIFPSYDNVPEPVSPKTRTKRDSVQTSKINGSFFVDYVVSQC